MVLLHGQCNVRSLKEKLVCSDGLVCCCMFFDSNMKQLLNPRGYLSATAIEMWITNPAKYESKYFRGEENDFENDFMGFGKKIATALETGEKTGDEVTDMVLSSMPRYAVMEHEMKLPLKTKYGYVQLLGKLDTFEDKPILHFRETKTGSRPWTKYRAQTSRQVLHYDLLIYLKYGMLAKERHLDWYETERNGDVIRFTGKIERFEVARRFTDLLSYMAVVSKVAKEIDTAYTKYLAQI